MDWGREGTSAPVHVGADPCVAAELPDMSKRSVLVVVLRRSGPHLAEGSLIPTGLFYGCLVLAGMGTALAVALGWSYAAVTRRVLRRRPVPPILLLGVVGITLRTVVVLVSGSTFVYFVQPILGTGAMAGVFVVSILVGRPMAARLALEFWPVSPDVMARPAVVRLFRGLTMLWAALNLLCAATTFALLLLLPVSTFVAVKQIASLGITSAGVAISISLSLATARREGLVSSPRHDRRAEATA